VDQHFDTLVHFNYKSEFHNFAVNAATHAPVARFEDKQQVMVESLSTSFTVPATDLEELDRWNTLPFLRDGFYYQNQGKSNIGDFGDSITVVATWEL
jgi:hypothetical protein